MRLLQAIIVAILIGCPTGVEADPLDDLARDFWSWRARQQQLSHDDIPRIERPVDWIPEWDRKTVEVRRRELAVYEARRKAIDVANLKKQAEDEEAVRRFLVERRLLTS